MLMLQSSRLTSFLQIEVLGSQPSKRFRAGIILYNTNFYLYVTALKAQVDV